jgi:hypothetical protein
VNPHVHLLVSARTIDGFDRSPQQFFRRYNAKKPWLGGARKNAEIISLGTPWRLRCAWFGLTNDALHATGINITIDPHRRQRRLALLERDDQILSQEIRQEKTRHHALYKARRLALIREQALSHEIPTHKRGYGLEL